MKILVLGQNVKDTSTLDKGLALVKQWASTIGLNLQFDFAGTTKQFSSVPNEVGGYAVNPVEIFQEGKKTGKPFEIVLLVYDWTTIKPQPTNPADGGMSISIPIQWYTTYPEVFAEFLLHELSHYFAQKEGKPDRTHEYVAGFINRKDWYLYLIKPFIKPEVAKYTHFSTKEVVGLKPKLVEMLDKAREIAGIPFAINSGYRTNSHNAEIGGTDQSSHLKGEAVDLRARNSNEHFLITKGLIEAGFKRISRKYPNHIHADISDDKPQDILF